jgi:hypothetical protein
VPKQDELNPQNDGVHNDDSNNDAAAGYPGALGLIAKVPFGTGAAVLAGVLFAGSVGELVNIISSGHTTCCAP